MRNRILKQRGPTVREALDRVAEIFPAREGDHQGASTVGFLADVFGGVTTGVGESVRRIPRNPDSSVPQLGFQIQDRS